MMNDSRQTHDPLIEALIVKLARLYAPRVAPARWQRPGDLDRPLSTLARQLADEGVLVILADRSSVAPEAIPQVVAECVQAYSVLYGLLAGELFTRMRGVRPYYYSYSRKTLVIFFVAEAAPVIQALAGYVAPYAAHHPAGTTAPARELAALMEAVLKQLETGSLAASKYQALRNNGAAIIHWMLGGSLRQLPLLAFDTELFPPRKTPPPRPDTLPGISAAGAPPARPAPRPPYLSPEGDETTTGLAPQVALPDDTGDDGGDTTAPSLPPVPLPPSSPGLPPAPVPYRPDDRRGANDAGSKT